MKIQQLSLVLALSAIVASPLAMADRPQHPNHPKMLRQSFTSDTTRTNANGQTFTRHTEQTVTANGFRRDSTVTAPDGRTAQRTVTGSIDPENQSRTRTVSGTRMNGDTYSGERTVQRTENGYSKTASRTNAAGETASKQVDVVVDRENHTATKTVTKTGFDGESHTGTVVKTYQRGAPAGSEG